MKIVAKIGNEQIATVYVADMGDGRLVEFVESVQPPIPRREKWVLIISTLFGCPVGCRMCDAGGQYRGKLSADQLLWQIDFLVKKRFPDRNVMVEKFKIQFARMGEPALNENVLEVLEILPDRFKAPGLMPCISTVAPGGSDRFFERLLEIKQSKYRLGGFQLQFSLHSTDAQMRDWLMPIEKWDMAQIAEYGERFFEPGDRKVTLNFALGRDIPLEAAELAGIFDPQKFLIKITPINPTVKAMQSQLVSVIDPNGGDKKQAQLFERLRACGFEVIVSIGELEENKIGSNCGQFVNAVGDNHNLPCNSYTYKDCL